MLKNFETGKMATVVPHKSDFDKWCAKLGPNDLQAAIDKLNKKIDAGDIHTAGWMPGHDWTGTPFEPLYTACGKNITKAGMFFGLIVFKTFMDRDELWYYGRFSKDGKEIGSLTYFKQKNS